MAPDWSHKTANHKVQDRRTIRCKIGSQVFSSLRAFLTQACMNHPQLDLQEVNESHRSLCDKDSCLQALLPRLASRWIKSASPECHAQRIRIPTSSIGIRVSSCRVLPGTQQRAAMASFLAFRWDVPLPKKLEVTYLNRTRGLLLGALFCGPTSMWLPLQTRAESSCPKSLKRLQGAAKEGTSSM